MHASYSTESLKLNIVKQINVDLSINKLYGVIPRKIYHIKGPKYNVWKISTIFNEID